MDAGVVNECVLLEAVGERFDGIGAADRVQRFACDEARSWRSP
jgi:hypothetical protein